MAEPPLPRPVDRPQDAAGFPTYGRPEDAPGPPDMSRETQYQAPTAPLQDLTAQYQVPASPYQPDPAHYWPAAQPYPLPTVPYPVPYGTPGYGHGASGFPAMMPVRTNALAIAALITGLSSIVLAVPAPVAVGLGIGALVQLRRSGERGLAQAVIGLVVGALVMLGWAAVLVGFLLSDSRGFGDSGLPAPAGSSVGIEELVVGECFTETDDEAMVDRKPCTESHDGELYASLDLPAGAYPGDRQVADRSEAACEKAFTGYIGIPYDDSELEMASWSPDRRAWTDDDRRALCAVYGPRNAPVKGSLKGSRR